jgi:hypothetical protein
MDSFSYPFYDIEIEHASGPDQRHLVKILSVDGRRFTYELRGALTEDAIVYMKSLIDAAVFGDQIVERSAEGFQSHESPTRLKKHS